MELAKRLKQGQFGENGILFSLLLAIVLFAPKYLFFGSLGFGLITLGLNLGLHKSFKWPKIYFAYTALYALYVISLFWTYNYQIGFRDVEYKMLLMAGPVVFSYSKWKLNDLNALILGFNLVMMIAFIKGIIIYLNCYDPIDGCFSNGNNALGLHPTYMGLYAVMAAIMALYGFLFTSNLWAEIKYKLLLKMVLIGFFMSSALYVYMVASKASLISLLLAVGILVIVWLRKVTTKKQFLLALIIFGLSSLSVSYWVVQKPQFEDGIVKMKQYRKNREAFKNSYRGRHWRQIESNVARILVWDSTRDLISDYPLGVGPGDVNDMLMRKYTEEHFRLLKEHKLNPHNQFLQIQLGLGIFGLALYIIIIGYSLVQAFKRKFPLLGILAFILFLNSLFESILEIQLGIFFLVFFSLIFDQLSRNKVLRE